MWRCGTGPEGLCARRDALVTWCGALTKAGEGLIAVHKQRLFLLVQDEVEEELQYWEPRNEGEW